MCVCVCSFVQLLEKYFQQLDEIETLKEQLKCRKKEDSATRGPAVDLQSKDDGTE